jgi:hypothetical protein
VQGVFKWRASELPGKIQKDKERQGFSLGKMQKGHRPGLFEVVAPAFPVVGYGRAEVVSQRLDVPFHRAGTDFKEFC